MWKVKIGITIVTAAMLVIFLLGCGGEIQEEPPVNLLGTTPSDGGDIALNGILTLEFDNPPGIVTVNGIPAKVEGNNARWDAAGFLIEEKEGSSNSLTIVWENKDGSIRKETTITIRVPPI